MTNPNGTEWETKVVELAHRYGCRAVRLAKMGFKDVGDVLVITPSGDHYLVEAKWREQLNVHATLGNQITKAATADLPWYVTGTSVWWKRSRRKSGNERRSPAGPPVVAITIDEYLRLISGNQRPEQEPDERPADQGPQPQG